MFLVLIDFSASLVCLIWWVAIWFSKQTACSSLEKINNLSPSLSVFLFFNLCIFSLFSREKKKTMLCFSVLRKNCAWMGGIVGFCLQVCVNHKSPCKRFHFPRTFRSKRIFFFLVLYQELIFFFFISLLLNCVLSLEMLALFYINLYEIKSSVCTVTFSLLTCIIWTWLGFLYFFGRYISLERQKSASRCCRLSMFSFRDALCRLFLRNMAEFPPYH